MVTPKLNLSCRFDYCGYSDSVCLIQDYKALWSEPDPVKLNSQMRVQALLVAINLIPVANIEKYVVQLVTGPYGVMEATFTHAELAQMYEDINETLRSLESTTAQLNPSPDACEYCEAVLICQAVKDMIKPTVTLLRASPLSNDPQRMADALDGIKILRGYMDEYETYCRPRLTADPKSIEGYEMVPGAEVRGWKDLATARTRLDALGIDHAAFMVKTHSPASYLNIYAKHFRKKPDEVREAFDQLMDGCIEVKQNKASLKRTKGQSRVTEVTL